MTIREIKPAKPKSHPDIIADLKDALKEARDIKFDSVVIILRSRDDLWTKYNYDVGADLTGLAGELEDIKLDILKDYKNDSGDVDMEDDLDN